MSNNPPPELVVRPALAIYNRQRTLPFDLKWVRLIADAARAGCLAAAKSPKAPLVTLEHVEVSVLSDKAIAVVHGEFFDDPTPTDVITFHHGELLLGAGVITENARLFGQTASHEAALCVIHGMMHLGGWEDAEVKEAQEMSIQQERIFKTAQEMVAINPS